MKKRILVFVGSLIALAAMVVPGVALAHTQTATALQSYGPYAGSSSDSGTCRFWASDHYNRLFTVDDSIVNPTPANPVVITENFQNGVFYTTSGSSPNACNAGPDNGTTVAANVTGQFSGYELITITGGTFNPLGCQATKADCALAGGGTNSEAIAALVNALYGVSRESWDVTTFALNYTACTSGLTHWYNASTDLGGNSGDISGTQVACPTPVPPTPTPVPPTPTPTKSPVTTPGLPNTGSDPSNA